MADRDEERVHLGGKAVYDADLLGTGGGKGGGNYVTAIETGADLEEDEEDMDSSNMPKLGVKQVKCNLEWLWRHRALKRA